MLIDQIENDRSRFEQHKVIIDERWDATVGVYFQIVLRFLRIDGSIHEYKIVLLTEFFEHHVGRCVGVAWEVVKLVHGFSLGVCTSRELKSPSRGDNEGGPPFLAKGPPILAIGPIWWEEGPSGLSPLTLVAATEWTSTSMYFYCEGRAWTERCK